jgi:hypothetical protein
MNLVAGHLDGAGAIEEALRSARRSHNREYDRRHRTELRAKSRERYQARIPKVDAGVLSAARQDLQYERKHAITEYVICRVVDCGAKAKRLSAAHLRNLHRMTTAQYRKLFPRAPLLSSAMREEIGATQKGRRGERVLRLCWLVADGMVNGKPFATIAKSVQKHPDVVRHYASRLGLGSGWRRFDLGSRVTNGSLMQLLKGTGLDSRHFAEVFAIPRWVAAECLKPSVANYDVSPIHVESVVDARDQLILDIERLSLSTAHRWGPNLSKCLRSLVPDLPQICQVLRSGLALSRDYLRANPRASITDWQEWLCAETLGEIEQGRRDTPFAAFLPLAVELSQKIEAELDSIRSVGRIVYIAARVLGAHFSIGYSAVLHGARVDRLPPLEMKSRILSALLQKREPGRPSDLTYQKALADMKKGLNLRQVTQKHLASYYRRDPERAMGQMKKGVKRLRQKLQ